MKPKGFFTTFRVILSVYGYRGTNKKLTGFDCKLFSCLLFVRQTLPRNRPRISYQFHPYSSFQGLVHFKAESVFIFVNDNFFYQQTQICVTQLLFTQYLIKQICVFKHCLFSIFDSFIDILYLCNLVFKVFDQFQKFGVNFDCTFIDISK